MPVTPWARSLAIGEAVAGTLFLTTVIARIVGAYIPSPSDPDPPGSSGPAPAPSPSEEPG